jgi:ABC-type multidrug transport system ATPase subunit
MVRRRNWPWPQLLSRRLAKREDVTAVIASQIPEIIETLAHRVLVLDEGRVDAFDSVDNLKSQTGADTFGEALERVVNSETSLRIDAYFDEGEKA